MSNIALQTGLRALLSARYSLDTIGHNLANANTVGYTRQRVELGSAQPLQRNGLLIGGGVQADRVQRTVDGLLNKRILNQLGIGGGLEAQLGLMSEMEAFFGEPGENSLGSRLNGFFSSIPRYLVLRSTLIGLSPFRTLAHSFSLPPSDPAAFAWAMCS